MQVYVVSKTLYGNSVVNDAGYVGAETEVVGVFLKEEDARKCQEDLYNGSDYEAFPWDNPVDTDPYDVYIDVVLEEMELEE